MAAMSEKELEMLAREFRAARASRNAAALILEEGLEGRLMEVIEAGLERVVVGGAGAAGAGAGSGGCSAVGVSTSGGGFGVVLTFLNDLRAKLLVDGLMDSTREMADDLWVSLFGRSLAVMTESGLVLVVLLICCSSRKDGLGEL